MFTWFIEENIGFVSGQALDDMYMQPLIILLSNIRQIYSIRGPYIKSSHIKFDQTLC